MNVGLICRAAANMGVEDIRVVQPQCDLHDKQVRQYALHAHAQIKHMQVEEDILKATKGCDFIVGTSAERRNCESIPRLNVTQVVERVARTHGQELALIFGNEATGLNNEELLHAQACLHLPMPGTCQSFNLSHAVVVALYLLRQEPYAPPPSEPLASPSELAHLQEIWLNALENQDYFKRLEKQRFAPKLQRLLDRLDLKSRDIKSLYGMFRHFAMGPGQGPYGKNKFS
jgi:TrmH family RNA methyltransferase